MILLGGESNTEHFRVGKTIVISSLDKLVPAVGFKPTTAQSLSGGVTPKLTHRLNHSATENIFYPQIMDWITLLQYLCCLTKVFLSSEVLCSGSNLSLIFLNKDMNWS